MEWLATLPLSGYHPESGESLSAEQATPLSEGKAFLLRSGVIYKDMPATKMEV